MIPDARVSTDAHCTGLTSRKTRHDHRCEPHAITSGLRCAVICDKGKRSHNGGTISLGRIGHQPGGKPAGPQSIPALRTLHEHGINLLITSDTMPCEKRWPALRKAGIDDLFTIVLPSRAIGVSKPDPVFCRLVLAAEVPPDQVLFAGGNLECDAAAPPAHGMRAALIRPDGLRPRETLPRSALLTRHVSDIPALLEAA